MFINSTSLIIPTKDRLDHLKRLFDSLKENIESFDEILLVDSSIETTHLNIIRYFSNNTNLKVIKSIPSSSIQRNIGIKVSNKNNKFIMFCDDDIIFDKNSLDNMDKFIKIHESHVGFGFNSIENFKYKKFENLKKTKILAKNGFYHFKPGIVCENGWHTKINNVKENFETMWLSTQSCVYQRKYIRDIIFDNNLGKYSYLEDLFFSYDMYKKGKLIICSTAKYYHKNFIERKNFWFGYQEVVNRYKFVKKNNLSIFKFYITIILKTFSTLIKPLSGELGFFPKFFGNLIGIFSCMVNYK